MKKLFFLGVLFGMWFTIQPLWAAEETGQEAAKKEQSSPLGVSGKALAAAIAVGLSALASGIAQGRIGAAGAGALAEKPEVVGSIIILEAIPETMIILGFVVAVL